MERSSTGLGSYISAIHYGDSVSALFEERIFDYGITHRPPQLVSDRCNRILLYPGSFNPPHLGHQELLRHAFSRSGSDLNIIAAIVLPLDDTSLASKFKGQTDVQIFTKAQRVRLWKDHVPSEWYWVYDRSIDEWFTFKDSLTEAILREGFDIEFVLLCGPDYVKMNRVPLATLWGCKGLLVSDVSRAADFTNGTVDYLTTLNDCEPWETIVSNHENLRKRAKEDSNWVWSGLFMLNPKFGQSKLDTDSECVDRLARDNLVNALEKDGAVRTCHIKGNPESTIRFISKKSQMTEISSTMVRRVLRKQYSADNLRQLLESLVMNPEILIGYSSNSRYKNSD